MSKIIRDGQFGSPSQGPTPVPHLSNAAVVNLLKACQAVASECAQAGFARFVDAVKTELKKKIDFAYSNSEATRFSEIQKIFLSHGAELERYFCGYVAEGFVKFKRGALNTSIGLEDAAVNASHLELSLLDDEVLDETIVITSMTQKADNHYAEPLWALNQRFAVLNEGRHVVEATNPAAPIQLCESLRRAFKLLPLEGPDKVVLYQVFEGDLIQFSGRVIGEVNELLKSHNILPNLRYSVPGSHRQRQSTPASTGEAPSTSGLKPIALPEDHSEADLLRSIRALQHQLTASAGSTGAQPVTIQDIVQALATVEQLNSSEIVAGEQGNYVPLAVDQVVEQVRQQLSGGEDGKVTEDDMQTIDLVGMLFEYMLNDDQLPANVKAVLSHLHTPFLKIAFMDRAFFENDTHPARKLLNQMAETGAKWVGNDGSSQYGVLEKIKEVVETLLKGVGEDATIVTDLQADFSDFHQGLARRQELMEKRAREKVQGEERLREVKIRVYNEVRDRINGHALPSTVLLFLLQPWTDYLSFVLLRHGEETEAWQDAIAVIDQLLWAISAQAKVSGDDELASLKKGLFNIISHGFSTIGYDHDKADRLIHSLGELIDTSMANQNVEAAPEKESRAIKAEADAKAGVAEEVDSSTPEERKIVESLKMMEFGTWFEFEDGKRLKVAWSNARTSHYMLVNQMGKRELLVTGIELARKMIHKEAKMISGSAKPFFERALDNIYRKLAEKADLDTHHAN